MQNQKLKGKKMKKYKNVEDLESSEDVKVDSESNSNGNFSCRCCVCRKCCGYATKIGKNLRFIRYQFFPIYHDLECRGCGRQLEE